MSPLSAAEYDLKAYYDLLSRHDWYHMMSEDYSVVRAGASSLASLRYITMKGPEYRQLFDAWNEYMWHKGPRPSRPGGPNFSGTCIEENIV